MNRLFAKSKTPNALALDPHSALPLKCLFVLHQLHAHLFNPNGSLAVPPTFVLPAGVFALLAPAGPLDRPSGF